MLTLPAFCSATIARVRRRYGSITISDDGQPQEELRYYQYTLLKQDEPAPSRGKKRRRVTQADDESESAYLFHVVPAGGG